MSSRKRSRSESGEGDHQTTPLTSDTTPTPTTSNSSTSVGRENAAPTWHDAWQELVQEVLELLEKGENPSEEAFKKVFFYIEILLIALIIYLFLFSK